MIKQLSDLQTKICLLYELFCPGWNTLLCWVPSPFGTVRGWASLMLNFFKMFGRHQPKKVVNIRKGDFSTVTALTLVPLMDGTFKFSTTRSLRTAGFTSLQSCSNSCWCTQTSGACLLWTKCIQTKSATTFLPILLFICKSR